MYATIFHTARQRIVAKNRPMWRAAQICTARSS
ncbi:hypothetical protein SUDANB66_06476 (plasmid) [Streptomyces sp. SudanB66_2053]